MKDDLDKYIENRKVRSKEFTRAFEKGYAEFKIGVILKQARQEAGLTQEQLAKKLKTKKSAISRIENHAEDIKLSTVEKIVTALGKRLQIRVS